MKTVESKFEEHDRQESLSEVHRSVDTTRANTRWKKVLAFFGPAYLVSVGYMDPGNWATDLQGGARYGYALIWVLLMSNLMALVLQSLSARLGIVRGRDLAQANREVYPKKLNWILYVLAELAIAATDLAEVLGMAIGIQLLTGLPLVWGVGITVLDTFLLLMLQRAGMRKMEAFIIALVAIIGFSFLIQIIIAKPDLGEVVQGFAPSLPDESALYIAIAIIGATVMPHNLYLHSALVQTRKIRQDESSIKKALKWSFIDSAIALNLAFLVNAAILVLAATVFYKTGRTDVAEIKDAHQLLAPLLGSNLAPILFAVALIAAGQSSTVTGTLAGQIVMEGYLRLRISPMARRLLTRLLAIGPAVAVILIAGENSVDDLLVFSQVILSLQLGFAIIPLIHFVSDREKMGNFAIGPKLKSAAWLITAVLVYLNVRLVIEMALEFLAEHQQWYHHFWVWLGTSAFIVLLAVALLYPIVKNRQKRKQLEAADHLPHPQSPLELTLEQPQFRKIAVALDFSNGDTKLLGHALGMGNQEDAEYLLIHVVESASARYHGVGTDDLETREDEQRLQHYVRLLAEKGIKATCELGYFKRAGEIVRIVQENHCDVLIIGAHGHSGLKDVLYGETVNAVRHELKIPVLVVNNQ